MRRTARSTLVMFATSALVMGGALTAHADEGGANATAVDVNLGGNDVVTVSQSHASTNDPASHSSAAALLLGGNLPGAQMGGESEGSTAAGSTLDTNTSNAEGTLGRLQLTPWSASSDANAADAAVAILRLDLTNETEGDVVSLDVLQSEAHHERDADGATRGSASSDGAVVNLGDDALVLRILHAETTSDGEGSSYLVSVNDQKIGDDQQAGGNCTIEIPNVGTIRCLIVDAEGNPAEALVAGANDNDDSFSVQVVTASSGGGANAAPDGGDLPVPEPEVLGEVEVRDRGTGELARTGGTASLLGLGFVMTALGAVARRARRWGEPVA